MPTTKAVTTMSETRSSLSPIDAAAKAQTVWFSLYVFVLFAAAIFTILLWRATNRYQALVKHDADARMAEANERTKALENANLILRKDLNEATGKVADAQRAAAAAQQDAAEAIARQQRVEIELATVRIDLAKQQERAARAEIELAKLRPRSLSVQQRGLLLQALRASRKGPVEVFCLFSDPDGEPYAEQIKEALLESGWPTTGVTMARFVPGPPGGLSVAVRDGASPPPHAQSLLRALATAGLRANLDEESDVPAGVTRLIVGRKP